MPPALSGEKCCTRPRKFRAHPPSTQNPRMDKGTSGDAPGLRPGGDSDLPLESSTTPTEKLGARGMGPRPISEVPTLPGPVRHLLPLTLEHGSVAQGRHKRSLGTDCHDLAKVRRTERRVVPSGREPAGDI